MKLHLPLSLRSALLLASAAFAGFGSVTEGAAERYWTDSSSTRHTLDRELSTPLNIDGASEFVLKDGTISTSSGGSYGGALHYTAGTEDGDATISAKTVMISGNKAIDTNTQWGFASGGALYLDYSAHSNGGGSNPTSTTPLSFAFSGCDEISITNNGAYASITSEQYEEWGLSDSTQGGAIAVYGASVSDAYGRPYERLSILEFKDNKHVYIRGNYLTDGVHYNMNSISTLDADLALEAPAGGTIEIYDGMDIDGVLWVNTTTPMRRKGQSGTYTGTVMLSGEHVESDLKALKGGKAPEEDEIFESKAHYAEVVYVAGGTLILKDVQLAASKDVSYSWAAMALDYHFYSDAKAEVQMTNATIYTDSYDGEYEEFDGGGYSDYDDDYVYQYGSVFMPKATFSGVNTIMADYVYAKNGTWTFNVSSVNKNKAVLTIEFDDSKAFNTATHVFDTTGATFKVSTSGTLAKGAYKLLVFNNKMGEWVGRDSVTLAGEVSGKIGSSSSSSVYYTVEPGNMLTLWYNSGGSSASSHRAATTLTWVAGSGAWAEGKGGSKIWSGSVSDLNFYNGDSVVFNKAATVQVESVVLPAKMTVSNASGKVMFTSTGGQITGSASLTKSGAGELELNLANAYTGGTTLQAGKLTTGDEMALGMGAVQLQGGELNLNGKAVANEVQVSGVASITGGAAYTGKLALKGGALSGGALNLAQAADLQSGSIANDLAGSGSVVKSGSGTASLSGIIALEGESQVNGGTLELKSGSYTGSLTVNSGGKLTVGAGYELSGHITLNAGATAKASDGFTLKNGDILTLAGAEVQNGVAVEGGVLEVTTSGQSIGGDMSLHGGQVNLVDTLKVEGKLSTTAETKVRMALKTLIEAGGVDGQKVNYFEAQDTSGVIENQICLDGLEGARVERGMDATTVWVWLKYERLVWDADTTGKWAQKEKGGEWKSDNTDIDDRHFYNLDFVAFDNAGEVEVEGDVNPGNILVQGDGNTTFTGGGSIIGEADLVKEGAGVLKIETDNSAYTGEVKINAGTLEVGHNNALGSGAVYVSNATFDGGYCSIANTVTFRGKSHITHADGATTVALANGASVSGEYTLASGNTVTVGNEGATFTGSFTFAGGTLALTGGVFNLTGDVEFADDEATRSGNSSLTTIDLSGWADLTAGTYKLATMLTEEDAARYFTISGLSANLLSRASLEYTEDALWLTIRSLGINPDIYAVLNRNQQAVYRALGAIAEQDPQPTGTLAEMTNAVLSESDPATVRALLDRLDGAELATTMTSQIAGNLAHQRRLRSNMGRGQAITKEGEYAAYVVGYDEVHRLDADANGLGYRRSEWGASVGVEYGMNPETMIGVSLNNGWSKVSPTGGHRYHENDTRVDFYAVSQLSKKVQSVTSLGFGAHDYDITRQLPGALSARTGMNGRSVNFMQEVSYTHQLSKESSVMPYATIESSYNRIGGFAESGADTASLMGSQRKAWATDITVGARYISSFSAGSATGQLSLQAGIVASVGDTSSDLTLRFAGAPKVGFNVGAASHDRIGYSVGAGVQLPISADTAFTAGCNSILRGDSKEYGANVGVRVRF